MPEQETIGEEFEANVKDREWRILSHPPTRTGRAVNAAGYKHWPFQGTRDRSQLPPPARGAFFTNIRRQAERDHER